MLTRSFGANGQFQIADWTEELNVIPNTYTTIQDFGIFSDEPVASSAVTFEETIKDSTVIVDRVRGDRHNQSKDYTRKLHSFVTPHFNMDDAIYPKDLVNVRAYGSADEAEMLANLRTRKMERIRRAWDETFEVARAQIITAGTVYAPSGTVTQDWNSEFSFTRTSVDFVFGTGSTEILDKIEQCIASIQDNAGNGQSISGVVAFCSPTWFAALIKHPNVKAAYQYYSSSQEPLRQRLAAGNSASVVRREFFYGGVQFVECRDKHNGVQMIPAGKAYFVGQGTDAFKMYFSPAERFGLVGTLGEQVYYFEKDAPDGTKIEIETESNFACGLLRPGLIVEAVSSN
jgi:hypothetical protein